MNRSRRCRGPLYHLGINLNFEVEAWEGNFYFKVQIFIPVSYSKRIKCHPSGYINSIPFGQKWFKSCLSTNQELKKFQWFGRKTLTGLKAYLNYTSYILIHHIRDENYQSFHLIIYENTHASKWATVSFKLSVGYCIANFWANYTRNSYVWKLCGKVGSIEHHFLLV